MSQTSVSGYVQHEVQWTPWMRSSAGLRLDRFQFDVDAGDPGEQRHRRHGAGEPEGLARSSAPGARPSSTSTRAIGYHSNDARGTTITVDPATGEPADRVTPLARARGAEVGARDGADAGLEMDVAVWRLDLDEELLFVGDAGTTAPSRPSRRWGVEWNTYAAPRPWLTFDADLAWSRARFTDADPAGDRIPGAVERVASAGVTIDSGRLAFGSLRLRYFGPRNLVEDGSVRSSQHRGC